MIKLLFVCTGNICRSPTAEGVFRALVQRQGLEAQFAADSAGTQAYHIGEAPDPRSCQAALKRGYDLTALRARKVTAADFKAFDLILAMDRGHHAELLRLCPKDLHGKLRLFLEFAPQLGARDVPDPYYGGSDGFERVLDMVEAGCLGLLQHQNSNRDRIAPE